jgi:hypothetical protein
MGKARPARRPPTHRAAAWGLTILTLAVLAAFAARLTEELDADAVTEDLARSVHAALEPAHISIWLSE